ncbi:hypothetical protein D3C76_1195860 [compost metagenome]
MLSIWLSMTVDLWLVQGKVLWRSRSRNMLMIHRTTFSSIVATGNNYLQEQCSRLQEEQDTSNRTISGSLVVTLKHVTGIQQSWTLNILTVYLSITPNSHRTIHKDGIVASQKQTWHQCSSSDTLPVFTSTTVQHHESESLILPLLRAD